MRNMQVQRDCKLSASYNYIILYIIILSVATGTIDGVRIPTALKRIIYILYIINYNMYLYNCSAHRLFNDGVWVSSDYYFVFRIHIIMQYNNISARNAFSQPRRCIGIGRVPGACSRRPNCILYCIHVSAYVYTIYTYIIRLLVGQRFATDSLFSRKCETGLRNIFAPAALCTSI